MCIPEQVSKVYSLGSKQFEIMPTTHPILKKPVTVLHRKEDEQWEKRFLFRATLSQKTNKDCSGYPDYSYAIDLTVRYAC